LSRVVWRIATDARLYEADDLTGSGAKATGGRWNEAGAALVYASETRALACLETVVHLKAFGLPLNRYLVEITIPDGLWMAAEVRSAASLPIGWESEPAGRTSIQFGTEWIRSLRSALLVVPSVIVPEEQNVLINPAHSDSRQITAIKVRRWLYDHRLAKTAKS